MRANRASVEFCEARACNRIAIRCGCTRRTRTGGEVFVELLDLVAAIYPSGKGHIVCDNQSSHHTDDVLDWLMDHPRWSINFTPKHASWLNQVECYFSTLQRRLLARGSFTSKADLAEKITRYVLWSNEHAEAFHWSYRPKSWATNPPALRAG